MKRKYSHRRRTRKKRNKRQRGGAAPEKCLFAKLGGGIGNQLYMYAAALTVSKKLGLPICTPPPENKHSAKRYSELLTATQVENTPETQARIAAADLALPNPATFYSKWADADIINSPSKDKKLPEGYFQNYAAMHSVIPEIRDMLFKNEFSKPKYKAYQVPAGSAFMHVRRGDYLQEGRLNSDDYYLKALEEMDKADQVTHIYVLSDDIAWCKQQEAKWREKTKRALECKDIPDELEALYFMSQCTAGAILSNSTFSSWGVYLGANTNSHSVIIYPKYNTVTKSNENVFEFPERWIAV
jgi:hypothetical protein